MRKMFSKLSSWVRGCGLLGNPGLKKELEDYTAGFHLALETISDLEYTILGLNAAIAQLQQRNDTNHRNAVVAIASLLTTMGGKATISADISTAVSDSDLLINYNIDAEGNTTLTLADETETNQCCSDDNCRGCDGDK
jgi:hypothetical protein